jgi:asparagine synthase (glutamine-hydrolysing)
MCGIAGCISKETINRDRFEQMVDIIEHRGPDDRGTYYDGEVALGHRRLSIIDLSIDGHQPFFYTDKYILVFNGEIYNYLELKSELSTKGYGFKTKTDTEVLAASYACWGEDCVQHFNGMWSFLIYDKCKNIVFGSRDRFGVKPFYYTRQENMFLVASEIKQFFQMLYNNPKVNKDMLLQFIIKGNYDYSKETMFADVYQLEPGYNLIYDLDNGDYRVKKYYDFEDLTETDEGYEKSCETFRKIFTDSVKLRLRADVPLGYSLSGGLDSSAIVCVADRLLKENDYNFEQHTISSCFEDKRYDEQEYIDEVVKNTNVTVHKIFPQETDLFEQLDHIIWHMDEPFSSTSVYAGWNVQKAADENGLRVMISGQGADEQLCGYTDFYITKFADLLCRGKFGEFKREWKIYKEKRAVTEQHVSIAEILQSSLISMIVPDSKRYLIKSLYYRKKGNQLPFTDEQILKVLKTEPLYPVHDPRGYISAYMKGELRALLHHEDRNSMAHSVEERNPFLDYRLVEELYKMPYGYKLREGITKAVMRDGLNGILPDKIRNRVSKLGFVTPEDQWINNNYDKYREELRKASDALKGVVDTDKVLEWFDSMDGKVRRGNYMVWRIICAGHWMKVFNVESGTN